MDKTPLPDAVADTTSQDDVADVQFGQLRDAGATADAPGQRRTLDMLSSIPLHITVQLGETQLRLKELLALGPGAVIELDRPAGEPIDLLVNGVPVGRGDVVVVDEQFGLRITDIVSTEDRLRNL